MGKWLKGCEVCNAGLVVEMDRLIGNGISVNKAAKLLAEEGERKIGDLVYSAAAIRARYRYFKGLREPHPKKVGQSDQPKKKPSTSRESGKKSPKVVNAEKPEPDDEGPYLVTVGGDEGIVIETEDEAIEIEDEDA